MNNIKNMRLYDDRKGAVFDVPEKEIKVFSQIAKNLNDRSVKIYKCETLPKL